MAYPVLFSILIAVTLSACAQLALKMGVAKPQMESALKQGLLESLMAAVASPLIWLGLIIYGVSVAMWLWVLSRVDLSVAYPFVGISFLVTMVFGALLLNENITPMRIFGTILIVAGVILVARSA
jgi:multidrug transporter EmrE-like cation transporter